MSLCFAYEIQSYLYSNKDFVDNAPPYCYWCVFTMGTYRVHSSCSVSRNRNHCCHQIMVYMHMLIIFVAGPECISYLVLVTGCLSVGKIQDSDIFKITTTQFVSLRNVQGDEERIQEIKKLMNSGTFYFSWSNSGVPWDLTLCAQRKLQEHETDNRFFW